MRVVFMGTPEFSVPVLEALARAHEVVCVSPATPPGGPGQEGSPLARAGSGRGVGPAGSSTRSPSKGPRRRQSSRHSGLMSLWSWPMG